RREPSDPGPAEERIVPGPNRREHHQQQALRRGRGPTEHGPGLGLHLLHPTWRTGPDRHHARPPHRCVVAAGRRQRVDHHELRAHHPVHSKPVRQRDPADVQRALHHPGTAMKRRLATWFRSQRSQGITEFALIAPVILLMTFGIIDFGRGLYFYIPLQQAANEGARVAVRASYFIDPSGATHTWPTDADVATAVQVHAVTE